MRMDPRSSLSLSSLMLAVACGPGSDPPVMTTSSTSGGTTSSESTSATGQVTTSATTGPTTTSSQDTTATAGTTAGTATLGTTTDEPPEDCRILGCEDPEHWCVVFETIEDTGGDDTITAECLPFLPRCEGLRDQELLDCLEPMCCGNYGCPWTLDLEQMELLCHTDPGVLCGDACS